jgi:membrane protease subunit (stomatin/prohibitin family)
MVTIKQMRNQMMTIIMMSLMTMVRRMGTSVATMVIAMTMKKAVLLALWSMTTMMQSPLAMGMEELVMLPRRNQPRKFPTKE